VIAFVLFLIIKGMNKALKKQEAEAPVPVDPSTTDKLLMEIRDSLKK
jgi:large conductance mechanosensitive channel